MIANSLDTTQTSLARALGGTVVGKNILAPGPGHSRSDRSLSVKIDPAAPGGFVVHSFAGDSPMDCRDHVLQALGLTANPVSTHHRKDRARSAMADQDDDKRRHDIALRIWRESRPIGGTVAEAYLRSRGISMALPTVLRFHPELRHSAGGVGPAMVGLITTGVDDVPMAIHRTFLSPDGSAKAPVVPQKMMLGPCRGGAIRLGKPGPTVMIAEGVETALAAMQATGIATWSALSASGLSTLAIPASVRDVIVLADGDDVGEAAALASAHHWRREGRTVRIARPPPGLDFNDVLRKAAATPESGS